MRILLILLLVGMLVGSCGYARECNSSPLQEYNNNKVIIHNNSVLSSKIIRTMGPNGVMHRDVQYPVKRVEVRDVSGAGDSFLAGLVIQYVKTQDIEQSIAYANICATAVVQKPGVSVI